ncbi:hypothetical protein ACQ4PT_019046 [Festuca glaucescens]
MDGQWPQENSDVRPSQYNLMLQDPAGDDLAGVLGPGQNTNMGNTGDASAAAAGQDNSGNQRKAEWNRKHHKREQIQIFEAAFRQNPYPDEEQRRDIGGRLGITEQQVRFRRSALKTQEQKRKIKELEDPNEELQAERRAAMENNGCLTCAVEPTRQQLLAENARLKEELQRANDLLKTVSGGRAEEAMPNAMPSGGSHYPATNPSSVRKGKALVG